MIRFRPLLGLTLWTIPVFALLIGLGVWQIQRLHWKLALIDAVDSRIHAAPVPLADALSLPPDQVEWRHVKVEGRFLPGREVYYFAPGPHGQPGVQVIAPLMQDAGGVVLVDRGFVPDDKRDPASRAVGTPAGHTVVTGILRLSQAPGLFTPDPDQKAKLWFAKNVPQMAAALGVASQAPVLVEADATPNPGGFPLGGQTVVDFPNNHLQYAITWFGLALALLAVYLVYHRRQGRLGFG
jgi:surfeit locus 1 family protein